MVSTKLAKSGMALMITPNGSRLFPGYAVIGSGSGAEIETRTGLTYSLLSREYSSYTNAVEGETEYTYNFTVTDISGITLREFGSHTTSGLVSGLHQGDLWNIESTNSNPVSFNGSNELELQISWEFV